MSEPQAPYAHRNGEFEKPTVIGDFGFRPRDGRWGWIVHVVEDRGAFKSFESTRYEEKYEELGDGQYWGPLVGPWQGPV